jgi:hypothetical protein
MTGLGDAFRHREKRSDAAILALRHREERSDAAIHGCVKSWIATAYGLAMTGLGFDRVPLSEHDSDGLKYAD